MDAIVTNVEMAEALLASYVGELDRYRRDWSLNPASGLAQSAAVGAADQVYPEIWSRLDAARAAAASTDRDVGGYDQIRAWMGNGAQLGITSVTSYTSGLRVGLVPLPYSSSNIVEGNDGGVRAANDAIRVFRAAFPERAWSAADAVPELRTNMKLARWLSGFLFVLLAGCVLAAYVWIRS